MVLSGPKSKSNSSANTITSEILIVLGVAQRSQSLLFGCCERNPSLRKEAGHEKSITESWLSSERAGCSICEPIRILLYYPLQLSR
ncbi:MAG: hypothetical protein A2428_02140 [Bdellovibrionales bacterium RIFOXYC1_FULL_54_43]|nr:MAG: hypothetical protein A2428_02140 [Bdellovibrionales bacterium RIFOXYC1_FULL_54_43]